MCHSHSFGLICPTQVIEMTQVTAASDIWSVGCLIVEVLSGAPPYFELQPMSALFRIVQVRMRGKVTSIRVLRLIKSAAWEVMDSYDLLPFLPICLPVSP